MKKLFWAAFFCIGLIVGALSAEPFQFFPKASYDPAIPTLEQTVGHAWGEGITSHSEMESYLRALAASSRRVQLRDYGRSWEGRTLYYLVVASEENMARLGEIQAGLRKIADPRNLSQQEEDRLVKSLPVVVWLAYGVHGNEISSGDAALLTAYHLLAAREDDLVKNALKNSIVILVPAQNPDGRDRFIQFFRQTTGRWPDGDLQSAEHNEVWPGGRTNHYLFDMNRDWFARTQPETRGHEAAILEWYPQVFVDLHEMGSNSSYYFAPPSDPINPAVTRQQWEWLERFGRNNSSWFDRMNFDYFIREVYDSFYPGYGESWPLFQGSIGMTYEQASVRGLVVDRVDHTRLLYRDSVQHHFIASLSTIQTAGENRADLLRYFVQARRAAVEAGKNGPVKEYLIVPTSDPVRAARFVGLLMAQGVEVRQAETPFSNPGVEDYFGGEETVREFPAGTYSISLAQPAGRLIKTLLDKETPMDASFVAEQLRRMEKRLGDEIYDVTAWSMPLLYDVRAYMAKQPSAGRFKLLDEAPSTAGQMRGGKAGLAYLIPWTGNASAKALTEMLRTDLRVHSSDKPFTLEGKHFPAGSLIVKVKGNPEDLHERLERIAQTSGAEIFSTDSSWVEEGVGFGSNHVRFVKRPALAMAYNQPTAASSAGWARYLLEQVYGYPVTLLPAESLAGADLSKYDTLILPDTSRGYESALGDRGAANIRDWVRRGGVLVTLGGATRWLLSEKVGLLSSQREFRDQPKENKKTAGQEASRPESGDEVMEPSVEPEKEYPPAVAGALVRLELDPENWLAFGYDGDVAAMVEGSDIYTPIKLDQGRNAARYAARGKLRLSGFLWPESLEQLPGKAYLMDQPTGKGHVVAFAEDPNYRAFMDGLNLLFINAVFLGPAH